MFVFCCISTFCLRCATCIPVIHYIHLCVCACEPQPPLANLDSMFLYIEEVIDVSSRLLSLLDQKQVQPGDPQFLETLCKRHNSTLTAMLMSPSSMNLRFYYIVVTTFSILTGASFLSLSSDIEAAYKEYLANYNNVTVLENSYKQKEELWNEIVNVIKTSA